MSDSEAWRQRADMLNSALSTIRESLRAVQDVADDATERSRIAAGTSMYQVVTPTDRAAALGVTVDGTESPRDLLHALLIERGMPHPAEVMGALDDLGLTVVDAVAVLGGAS